MELFNEKLAYPYEYFDSVVDHQKTVDNLNKEDFFNKLKNDYPNNEVIKRTKEIIRRFNIKKVEQLTEVYLKKMYYYQHVFLRNL